MNKIPKAKCKKCKHCKLIKELGEVYCEIVTPMGMFTKPKRCSYFEKKGGAE